ncbi:RND transporter [Nocardioides zeae]|uniref:RND transporter n=1 Tax=Nocardioides zeae TaxID=1457234 RepID=A0A6P0HI13_9ACTN|nr:RND transporter [Nocardioides zeae]NEN77867.1 RND transporter [Nocardioides zeae]
MRRRILSALVLLAVLAPVAWGLGRVQVDTSVASFVPRGDDAAAELEARDEAYGADPLVVLLDGGEGAGLLADTEQLYQLVALEGRLAGLDDVAAVYGPGTVLNQTAQAIQDVLVQISGAVDATRNVAEEEARAAGASDAEAVAAGDAAVAPLEERYGTLLADGMGVGLPTLRNPSFARGVLFDDDGTPKPMWRFLVPDAKSATLLVKPRAGLDQAENAELTRQVRHAVETATTTSAAPDPSGPSGPSGPAADATGLRLASDPVITGVPALTSAVSATAADEAPRLGLLALVAVGAVFLLVPWARRRRDRLRPVACALLGTATTVAVFGWADRPLSLGVVAFLPIILGVGSDFPLYLSQAGARRQVLAVVAAAVVAFASLVVSPLPLVQEFGVALALGIVVTAGWALVLRRVLGAVQPAGTEPAGTEDAGTEDAGTEDAAARPAPPARGPRLAGAVAAAALAVVGWAALPSLPLQTSPQELAAGLPELADVEAAEDVLGFSGEITVVLRGDDVLTPEAARWSTEAEDVVATGYADRLRPLLTVDRLLGFLGEDATLDQVDAAAELLPSYLLSAAVSTDRTTAASTYGVVLDDLDDQRVLVDELRAALPEPPPGYTVELAGLPVVASSGLEAASSQRYLVGTLGILGAGLAVAVVTRSRRRALAVVATSATATGWVFAAVAVSGSALNPLTLAVGALVTVTSAEFVLMLRQARRPGWRHLRRSVLAAAVAGTLGYACLALSDLAVLRSFGLTLAGGVLASLAAAALVVAVEPALRRGGPRPDPAPAAAAPAVPTRDRPGPGTSRAVRPRPTDKEPVG